jgi:hypothetical protein
MSRRDVARIVSASLLSLYLFYPAALPSFVAIRVVALTLAVCALSLELALSAAPIRRRALWIALTVVASVLVFAAIEVIAAVLADRRLAVNAEHLLLLAPLLGGLGWIVIRRHCSRWYLMPFLVVAAVTALLAIIESFAGTSLFGRDATFLTSQREGTTRALLASEHVLVLGALLATAVPLAALIARLAARASITLLLIGGCWATGSRTAALLCALVAVAQAFPPFIRLLQRNIRVLLAIVGLSLALLAFLSTAMWTSDIPGDTGVEYSANYRFASYSLLPDILFARPFGYLLGTVPSGVWMMDSELRGPVDLARSADSELLFAAFAAGWLGIAVFVAAIVVAAISLRFSPSLGLATLLLTTLGLVMALHGWDAASLLWYFLLGASVGAAALSTKAPESALLPAEDTTDESQNSERP